MLYPAGKMELSFVKIYKSIDVVERLMFMIPSGNHFFDYKYKKLIFQWPNKRHEKWS